MPALAAGAERQSAAFYGLCEPSFTKAQTAVEILDRQGDQVRGRPVQQSRPLQHHRRASRVERQRADPVVEPSEERT